MTNSPEYKFLYFSNETKHSIHSWRPNRIYLAKIYNRGGQKTVFLESDSEPFTIGIKKFGQFVKRNNIIESDEEMCQYCFDVENQFRNIPLFDDYSLYVNVCKNELQVSYEDSYAGEQVEYIEISFCPHCGRKLEK